MGGSLTSFLPEVAMVTPSDPRQVSNHQWIQYYNIKATSLTNCEHHGVELAHHENLDLLQAELINTWLGYIQIIH